MRRPNSANVGVEWAQYTASSDNNINMTVPPLMNSGYAKAECDFWDRVFPIANLW